MAREGGVVVIAVIMDKEARKSAAAPMPEIAWPVISWAAEWEVADTR
ncbi:hypothetical protein [Streptomyces sp. TLI_185]|nr:hypothetical protein [Streptomyces sp. TLI_185]